MRGGPLQYFDDAEFSQFLRGCDIYTSDPDWHMYVECFRLMVFTGAREFEINCLAFADCHENFIEIQHGKGDKYRTSDIYPLGLPFYNAYLRQRQLEGHGQFLFPGRLKRKPRQKIVYFRDPVSTRTLRRQWAAFCKLLHLRYIVLHGLRKTFITWMAEELSVTDLMDQVGHDDIRTTNSFYRSSIPGRKFTKPEPLWKRIAAEGGQRLLEGQGVIQLAERRK